MDSDIKPLSKFTGTAGDRFECVKARSDVSDKSFSAGTIYTITENLRVVDDEGTERYPHLVNLTEFRKLPGIGHNGGPTMDPDDGYKGCPAEDVVVKPAHYAKWAIEPITFIMRNGFEFWRGNIVKYAARAGSKMYDDMDTTQSEITDLKKVIRYAEMRINQLEGETVL